MSSIFGGKKSSQSSHSENKAYGYLKDTFSPITGQAATGVNALSALLSGDPSGFNAYKKATGFDATAEAGSRGITGNAAAGGLLRSGSTGKALQSFGTQLQDQYAQNYLQNLFNQANLGFQAGSLIGSAGQVSDATAKSKEKPGLGGFIGTALAGPAAAA